MHTYTTNVTDAEVWFPSLSVYWVGIAQEATEQLQGEREIQQPNHH